MNILNWIVLEVMIALLLLDMVLQDYGFALLSVGIMVTLAIIVEIIKKWRG